MLLSHLLLSKFRTRVAHLALSLSLALPLTLPFSALSLSFSALSLSGSLLSAFFCSPQIVRADAKEIADPIEPVNRGIFWFNDQLDWMIFEPVATFYHDNLPYSVRKHVGNFMDNLEGPLDTVSNLGQGEFEDSGTSLARFLVNSTVGVLGIFDVATDWGLPKNSEDLGLTMGKWGVGHGFYLVLPFLGPSSLRDGIGRLGATYLNPTNPIYLDPIRHGTAIYWTITGIGGVHARSEALESIKSAREGTLDFYLASRSAYGQYRAGKLREGAATEDEFGDAVSTAPE